MRVGTVGRRYARAIFDLALEKGDFDKWLADLQTICNLLRDAEIGSFLANPEVSFTEKKEVVDTALPGLEQTRRNFVYLLFEKRRIGEIEVIVEEFQRLINQQRGLEIAQVTTAIPLSETMAAAVARSLSELTGKQIVLSCTVDPGIIGGIIAKIGDRLLDGSVVGRLESLRKQLS
ncbi:MAG: ATP synthase F1 subunit delta [Chloroflexi bacterium]|nr:ATP synthase F1 subunit delta [Chloroflexota bacterium]MCL5076394.1 ATP synthase F1 subunit delta [Chloroflexota bacterium]